MNRSKAAGRKWPVIIFLMFTFVSGFKATAADSLLYIGNLPVPGTNTVSDYLTRSQSGTLLENDYVSLKWQVDGNLVLYYFDKVVLWASNTDNKGVTLSFQKNDGKLIIKNSSGDAIWSSTGTGANMLKVRSDRKLSLLNSSGQQLWEAGSTPPTLQDDGTRHTIIANSSDAWYPVSEFIVPFHPAYKYLYLRAEGADGAKRVVTESWGDVRFSVAGGSGATIIGIFEIGTGPKMIAPGSTLRIVIGAKGNTVNTQQMYPSDGGGGTGIMVRKPNDQYWHLLMVAGGGGGAFSDCCLVKRPGRSAETTEDGGKGGNDKFAGGKNGNNGAMDGWSGYCGGGINMDGWGNKTTLNGSKDYVVTGLPSSGVVDWDGPDGSDSGLYYGMGPGGANGATFSSSGGGGGFSGGGAGAVSYPGGGGGSFVNTDMAIAEFRKKNASTNDTQNGFVDYQFSNTLYQPVRMEKYSGSCLTDLYGQTGNGTSIVLSACTGSSSQNWSMQGLTMNFGAQLDKCLNLTNSDTDAGTAIQLYDCNGTKAQVWIYDGISKYIRSGLDMNKCFHAADGSNPNMSNNLITVWDCKDVANMRWAIDGATNPTISTSQNRILYAGDTQKCIDVYRGNTDNGTNIQLYDCNYGAAQNWYFDNNVIRFNKDRNKCLDLTQSKTDNGNNLQLYDCNGTNAQKWTYNGITKSFHSWVDPEKCIDVTHSSTANGTNIQLYDCNGTGAQQFVITN